jgi:hypothetical protein
LNISDENHPGRARLRGASKEILMSTRKLKRLQAAGWKVGTAKDFLGLTRDFKETVLARAQRDARLREALFTEAINAYLAGDTTVGNAVLRDLVNATI